MISSDCSTLLPQNCVDEYDLTVATTPTTIDIACHNSQNNNNSNAGVLENVFTNHIHLLSVYRQHSLPPSQSFQLHAPNSTVDDARPPFDNFSTYSASNYTHFTFRTPTSNRNFPASSSTSFNFDVDISLACDLQWDASHNKRTSFFLITKRKKKNFVRAMRLLRLIASKTLLDYLRS